MNNQTQVDLTLPGPVYGMAELRSVKQLSGKLLADSEVVVSTLRFQQSVRACGPFSEDTFLLITESDQNKRTDS